MQPFSVYPTNQLNDCPVIVVSGDISVLDDEDFREEINESLSAITEQTFNWPQAGIEAIADVLDQYDMELPAVELNGIEDEMIFVFGHIIDDTIDDPTPLVNRDRGQELEDSDEEEDEESNVYLYVYYEFDANQKYHFYAELVDTEGLFDLLEPDVLDSETGEALTDE